MMDKHSLELSLEKLRNRCDPDDLGFETTDEVEPEMGPPAQERASNAIEFGIQIRTDGYHLFVAGLPGSGRMTMVREQVQKLAATQPTPPDHCYVHNFKEADKPSAIELPAGSGTELAKGMDGLVEGIKRDVPLAFESENYEQRKTEAIKDIQNQRDKIIADLQQEARQKGFAVEATPIGFVSMPLVEGKPISREDFDQLPDDRKNELMQIGKQLEAEVEQALRTGKKLEKEVEERTKNVDREIALFAVGPYLSDLHEKFKDFPKVLSYLSQVEKDILDHLEDFKSPEKATVTVPGLGAIQRDDLFDRYKVNVFVNNGDLSGAPVVFETNPSYYNLMGRVEYRARLGSMVTDFSMIKPGALQRANGGYLVVDAREVLFNFLSWDALKRALLSKEARMENIGEQYSFIPTSTLRPEPIPLNVKVIMLGSPYYYSVLYALDEDFRKLFKVKAEFSADIARTEQHINRYAAFISARCRKLGLKPFHKSGVARVVEYGSRAIEHQNKLSALYSHVGDLVNEANFWASKAGSEYVMAEHVDKAIDEKVYRSNMVEEKMQELIDDGTIIIDTDGIVSGQVNGLSILDIGDYYFGRPSRITATTSMGWGGPINIEREAKMSGRIHNKGFLILSSYLAAKFAQDKPLSLSASIVFEQLYDEVEGDSASSTELYALLSSLAGVGIKQGIAVTGSVDQYGRVQAIGGVTRKIEGFFAVCKAHGLDGTQGVMIPETNVKNLMLREEVIQAVEQGLFHIYAVRNIEEGLELLTEMPFGKRRPDGTFAEGTISYLVDQRLREYARRMREFAKPAEETRPGERERREAA